MLPRDRRSNGSLWYEAVFVLLTRQGAMIAKASGMESELGPPVIRDYLSYSLEYSWLIY